MKKLVIFASGAGTNAANIIRHVSDSSDFSVSAIFTNKADSGVAGKAMESRLPFFCFDKQQLESGVVLSELEALNPDVVVLAGFLLQIPLDIITRFPGRILNIHPALLPKYGGKGMYGMRVHQAVLDNKERESGITIHEVDAHYDEGDVVFQASVDVSDCRSAAEIAQRVQQLEHEHFPRVVTEFALSK